MWFSAKGFSEVPGVEQKLASWLARLILSEYSSKGVSSIKPRAFEVKAKAVAYKMDV